MQFTVTADDSGDIYLYKVAVKMTTSTASVALTDVVLVKSTNESTTLATGSQPSFVTTETCTFTLSTPQAIPAGGSVTYYVKATVADGDPATGDASYSLQLLGVADADAVSAAAADVTGDFVWGDGSGDTPDSTTTVQWNNGYKVPGLSSDTVNYWHDVN
jgi:hypothetical protein